MAEQTITLAELTAAFKRVSITVGRPDSSRYTVVYGQAYGMVTELPSFPETAARAIYADVLKHREPEYVDGKVYRDADGDVYQYDVKYNGEKRWFEPGSSGEVPFSEPTRPLRLLG